MKWELVYNKDVLGDHYIDSVRINEWGHNNLMGDYRGCIVADFTASHGGRKHAYEEAEENAKLIVKAPEMFDMLVELTKEWEEELKEIGGCDHSVGLCVCGLKKMVDDAIKLIESVKGDKWGNIK